MSCIAKNTRIKDDLRTELNKAVQDRIKAMGNGLGATYSPSVVIKDITQEYLANVARKRMDEARKLLTINNNIEPRLAGENPLRAAMGIFDHDIAGNNALGNITDIAALHRAKAVAAGGEAFAAYRAKWTRSWTRAPWSEPIPAEKQNAVVDAILGLPTADREARELAPALKRYSDYLISKFRAAGGSIGKLDNFVPHHWTPDEVGKIGKTQWADELLGNVPSTSTPILDRGKITDRITNQPLGEPELRHAVEFAHDSISTDGLNKLKPGAFTGAPRLSRAREASRFLHFTPEGYKYLLNKYMDGDVIGAYMRWGDDIAKDTATLEMLGPNPRQMEKYIGDRLTQIIPGQKGKDALKAFNNASDIFFNRNNQPTNTNVANAVKAVGAVAAMKQLGSAAFQSVFSDPFTVSLRNLINGSNFGAFLGDYIKGMGNGTINAEMHINNLDVWETMVWSMGRNARAGGDAAWVRTKIGNTTTNVLEKSGLMHFYDNARQSVQSSMERSWLKHKWKTYDQLPDAVKRTFDRYGVDATHWDHVRSNTITVSRTFGDVEQVNYMRLINDQATENSADMFKRMSIGEARDAVISENLRGKMTLSGVGTDPSSTWGIVMRQIGTYAKWPASNMFSMFSPLARKDIPMVTKGMYLSWLAVGGFVFGALTVQGQQILAGKEPLPMTDDDGNFDPRFLATAWLKSGLASYYGDVAIRTLGLDDMYKLDEWRGVRQGASLFSLMPAAGMVLDAADNLVLKPIMKDEGSFVGDGLIRELTADLGHVLGLKVWYLKTAYDRFILDNLERLLSPDSYEDRVSRMETRMGDRNQEFLWEPPR